MNGKKKYHFENPDGTELQMRCPHCGELLAPQDLESYSVCPYCNEPIENTPELEDFVIEPMVRQWLHHISR